MNQTLTIAELARLLGVSRMTIHRMRQAGELPKPLATKRRFVRWAPETIQLWFELDCPNQIQFELLRDTKNQLAKSRGSRRRSGGVSPSRVKRSF